MGHYDNIRESQYAEEREKSRRNREAAVPRIADHLEKARLLLRQYENDIPLSNSIEHQLEILQAAIKGQMN